MAFEADATEDVEALEARKASPFAALFDATEKRLKSNVETAQCPLLAGTVGGGKFRTFMSQIGQFLALVLIAERNPPAAPGVDALFQAAVVKPLVRVQQIGQGGRLGFRRVQPVCDLASLHVFILYWSP